MENCFEEDHGPLVGTDDNLREIKANTAQDGNGPHRERYLNQSADKQHFWPII